MRVTTENKKPGARFNNSQIVRITFFILGFFLIYQVQVIRAQLPTTNVLSYEKNPGTLDLAVNVSRATRIELYLEANDKFMIIDPLKIGDLKNGTAPIIGSFTVNQLSTSNAIGEYVFLDLSVNIDLLSDKDLDRITLCIYDKNGRMWLHEFIK